VELSFGFFLSVSPRPFRPVGPARIRHFFLCRPCAQTSLFLVRWFFLCFRTDPPLPLLRHAVSHPGRVRPFCLYDMVCSCKGGIFFPPKEFFAFSWELPPSFFDCWPNAFIETIPFLFSLLSPGTRIETLEIHVFLWPWLGDKCFPKGYIQDCFSPFLFFSLFLPFRFFFFLLGRELEPPVWDGLFEPWHKL